MNRRDFLHKTTATAIIAAGLPQAIRNQQTTPSKYRSELQPGVDGQWFYEAGLFHSAVERFTATAETEKVIGLKVSYFVTPGPAQPFTKR